MTPKAKAKQTWDVWPAIHKLVRDFNTRQLERDVAHHLNIINESMNLHSWDDASKATWVTAETNFFISVLGSGLPRHKQVSYAAAHL